MSVPAPELLTFSAAATLLLAAFGGSLHCAAMCGPIRLLCPGNARFGYQAGRALAYALLGALAGWLGWSIPPLALVGVVMIAVALLVFRVRLPSPWQSLRARVTLAASGNSFLLGLSSGLLPCGLLHAWVLAAAATASPLRGAAVLGALWLGSLPALELGTLLLARPLARARARFPRALPVAVLLLALVPAVWRAGMVIAKPGEAPVCHHEHAMPMGK